jgi:hypothetical protein
LPEDRRDFEKLPGERRNQNPVEQTKVELEVFFQKEPGADAQNDKLVATTKAESSRGFRGLNVPIIPLFRDPIRFFKLMRRYR